MPDYKSRLKKAANKTKESISETPIPQSAALIKNLGEHANGNNFRLNFKYYNHSQCELRMLTNFRPLIDKFDYMTLSTFDTFHSRGRINNSGDYRGLFRGLPVDIDLEEIEFAPAPGRIIFFRVENYICLVTVLTRHRRV